MARIAIIACGALTRHVEAICLRRCWDVSIYPLPPLLHQRPERIAGSVRAKAAELAGQYDCIAVAYADCGTYGALDDPDAAPLGGEPFLTNGVRVGYVTSANFRHPVGRSIVYGYLPTQQATTGTRTTVRIFDRKVEGVVSTEPIFDPAGEPPRA